MESSSSDHEQASSDTEMQETSNDYQDAELVAEILYDQYINKNTVIDDLNNQDGDEDLLPQQPEIVPSDSEEILSFHGVEVTLPGTADESQKKLLDSIIDSIIAPERKNVLLESPPSNGETLALLCAPLGAFKHLEDTNGAPKKIRRDAESQHQLIYVCRTHNRVQTVISQLKKTIYKDTPMTILESRDHTCLNELANPSGPNGFQLNRSYKGRKNEEKTSQKREKGLKYFKSVLKNEKKPPKNPDEWCKVLRDPPTMIGKNGLQQPLIQRCTYYDVSKVSDFPQSFQPGQAGAFDIEEIVKAGQEKHVCPYYALREMKKEARLIFCNYNHLLDPFVRKSSGLTITDKTTIVLEKISNINKLCNDIGSIHIKGSTVNKLHRTISHIQTFHADYNEIHSILLSVFTKFQKWLQDEQNPKEPKTPPYKRSKKTGDINRKIGAQIFDILSSLDLSENQVAEHFRTVNSQLALIDNQDPRFSYDLFNGFFKITWFCKTLYVARSKGNLEDYAIILTRSAVKIKNTARKKLAGIELKVLCKNPRPIFEPVTRAHTLIATLGTVVYNPRYSIASKLGIKFHHQIQASPKMKKKRLAKKRADNDARLWEQYLFSIRTSESLDTNEDVNDLIPPLEPALDTEQVLNIDGVPIHFPYRAYQSQKAMMQKMINCIRSSKPAHALLESPSGTGKTAAILCGILGIFKHLEGRPTEPRILTRNFQLIYAARTKSQIHTVVEQLKLTAYKDTPTAILEKGKLTFLNRLASPEMHAGDSLISVVRGDYPISNDQIMRDQPTTENGGNGVVKIEVTENGTTVFPLYALRKLQKEAKIIICNYEDLLYNCIRGASGLNITKRTVLVFDDAHNIENVCRDIGSMHLSGARITSLLQEIESVQNVDPEFIEIRDIMADVLGRLNSWIHEKKLGKKNRRQSFKFVTDEIFQILETVNLSEQAIKAHYRALIDAINLEPGGRGAPVRLPFSDELIHEFSKILWTCKALYQASTTVDEAGNRKCSEDYTVMLAKVRSATGAKPTSGLLVDSAENAIKSPRRILKVLCNNPAVIFEPMKAAHTIIVTSGTLSPLDTFASELDTDFRYMESMPHVINSSRVFAAIIDAHATEKLPLNFERENVKNPTGNKSFKRHAEDLARIILDISSEVPNGILVFFPSEELLNSCKEFWETNEFLDRMSLIKDVYFEPSVGDSNHIVKSYKQSAVADRGALFFALMQGRLFQGVHFRDAEARTVITVGIPFIPKNDHDFIARHKFNLRPGSKLSYHYKWHSCEAHRTLNQALGKCIRHVNDWGLIFMVDSRLARNRTLKFLPLWVKPSIVAYQQINQLSRLTPRIRQFVAAHQARDGGSN